MARSKQSTTPTTADRSGPTRRKQTEPRNEIKLTWSIPKHADAKHDNPDDWTELAQGEPLPEPYRQAITKAFAPMVGEFLQRFHLSGDDFDGESWSEFVRAFFDSLPERVCQGPKGEKTDNLIRIVRQTLEKKYGPLPDVVAVPTPAGADEGVTAAPGLAVTFTRRQGQFLAFIHQYRMLHRQGPDEADLGAYFRATSPSVRQMLGKLEALRLIARDPGAPRSIRVTVPAEKLPALNAANGPAW
jgi:repressor LexA